MCSPAHGQQDDRKQHQHTKKLSEAGARSYLFAVSVRSVSTCAWLAGGYSTAHTHGCMYMRTCAGNANTHARQACGNADRLDLQKRCATCTAPKCDREERKVS